MRLKPSCTTNDICDVFGALGLPVALSDVRLYKLKKNFRKASVFFHRYTDYKKAVQILGIVNEAMISGPLTQGPFDALAGEIDKRVEVSEKPKYFVGHKTAARGRQRYPSNVQHRRNPKRSWL